MSLASRIITALVGLGLILFFWPFGSGEEVISAVEPRPSKPLFTKPLGPDRKAQGARVGEAAKANHAIAVAGETRPQTKPPAKADDTQTAALPIAALPIAAPVTPKLFYRVVVRDGGTIEASGLVITLGGITARKASAQCKDERGRAWPCGARARVALMRLIHGRAVTCQVPISSKRKSLTARCTVGGSDLSTWMVAQGWAEPKAPKEKALADGAAAARKKRIGMWR